MSDAYIVRIKNVKKHSNADKLNIGIRNGDLFICVKI
jgi:signal transduction histidine kinase